MAEDELGIVRLKNDFYRDGINKIFLALSLVIASVVLLLITSFYLHTQKPSPVVFETDVNERAFAPAPIDVPFLKDADLLQWLNDVITKSFTFDFINYKDQVSALKPFYTENGYAKLLTLLNNYANPDQVKNTRMFVSAAAGGVPAIYNQGITNGRYTWILHVPIAIAYSSGDKNSAANIELAISVVRTLIDTELAGVAIDDIGVINKPAVPAV